MIAKTKVLIISSYLDNSGGPKQLVSLVKYLNQKGNVDVTVRITHTAKREFYDDEIIINSKKLIKKNLIYSSSRLLSYMYRRFPLIDRLFRLYSLRSELKAADSVHIVGIKPYYRLKKLVQLNREIVVWHNTHKIQYCSSKDENYLEHLSNAELENITFVTIDELQARELKDFYSERVKVVIFKLFKL